MKKRRLTASDPFDMLSDDALLDIFRRCSGFRNALSLVCKRFNTLERQSREFLIFRVSKSIIDLNPELHGHPDGLHGDRPIHLHGAARTNPTANTGSNPNTRLNASPCPLDCDVRRGEVLSKLLRAFPNLKELELRDVNYRAVEDERLLQVVGQFAPKLEVLNFHGDCGGQVLSQEGITSLAHGCPRLRRLSAQFCSLNEPSLRTLSSHCPLQELEMDFPRIFARDLGLAGSASHESASALATCRNLIRLQLRFCSDEDLLQIASGCPLLSSLTLMFSLIGPNFVKLARSCHKLRKLTLRSCDSREGSEAPMAALFREENGGSLDLEELQVQGGSFLWANGLQKISEACKGLKKLSLEFMVYHVSLAGIGQNTKHLEELTLQYMNVSEDDLELIGKNCTKLRQVLLSGSGLPVGGVLKLVEGRGQTLKVLGVRVPAMKDSLLETIGSSCVALERLVITGAFYTDDGIEALCRGKCVNSIQRLKLNDCAVTDKSMALISSSFPNLHGLSVKSCGVTSDGISSIVCNCFNLELLEVDKNYLTARTRRRAMARGTTIMQHRPVSWLSRGNFARIVGRNLWRMPFDVDLIPAMHANI